MKEKNNLLLPLTVLSAAILISVIIFSSVWKSARTAEQTISVTGSAKQTIISDLGILHGRIEVRNRDPKIAYQMLRKQMPVLQSYLAEKGFPKDKVELFTINSYPIYELNSSGYQTQNISQYVYNQRFEVQSNDVNEIKELSLSLSSLVEKGLSINVDQPEYHYTKLDDIKIAIQAEAAKNAMMRAQEIAKATDRDLGPLRSARMGVIQITPLNSNMVSDYGMNDVTSIEKEITAVVGASFEID